MDDSNGHGDVTLKLAIKTPKEKKDISVNASITVKQVRQFDILYLMFDFYSD